LRLCNLGQQCKQTPQQTEADHTLDRRIRCRVRYFGVASYHELVAAPDVAHVRNAGQSSQRRERAAFADRVADKAFNLDDGAVFIHADD
jgi:hypothetical protein